MKNSHNYTCNHAWFAFKRRNKKQWSQYTDWIEKGAILDQTIQTVKSRLQILQAFCPTILRYHSKKQVAQRATIAHLSPMCQG